jgi:hypothetical protein
MIKNSPLFIAVFYLILLGGAFIQIHESEINKTYPKKEYIRLKASLGSCRIIKSTDDKIHVHLIYSFYDDEYLTHFSEEENELDLEEEFTVKNPHGKSLWTISIPEETKINFKSGTGGFAAEGVKIKCKVETGTGSITLDKGEGDFNISTGTGSINFTNMNGDFKASSGTGSIEVDKSEGAFKLSSGTGSLDIQDIVPKGSCKFNSGTGSINVSLSAGSDQDILIGSGTGNAVLDYKGNPLKGYFEFKAKKGHGSIISPVKFENEETIREGHEQYYEKTFKINGKNSPVILIQTGTGVAKLVK